MKGLKYSVAPVTRLPKGSERKQSMDSWVVVERLSSSSSVREIRVITVQDVEKLPGCWQLASGVFDIERDALEYLANLSDSKEIDDKRN